MKRTFNKETLKNIDKKVRLMGWVETVRSHGKLLFFDLRDMSGISQVVVTPNEEGAYGMAKEIKPEYVVEIIGEVKKRPDNMVNKDLETGKVEIKAEELNILSCAETLPFPIDSDGYEINEKHRLKYRYIDLKRKRMQKNLKIRQQVIHEMRNILISKDFIEVETPILTKSTPEGARDFVVPSRNFPGNFYALAQSPQQYKQLLICSGLERYFQVARCLRDEDPRGDRQAEFTQLDIEMAFPEKEDIMELIEEIYIKVVEKIFPNKKIQKKPFPIMTYTEAMEKYGTDKPNLKKKDNELAFCFVIDFPMFEWKQEYKRWGAVHHPFTRPKTDDLEEIKKCPENIFAHQFDLVLNGYEIAGGSLRSFVPEMLQTCFEVMGHKEKDLKEQFGHLFEAFKYGVPPHGGIASGLDRFLAVALDEDSIREVIAFPKTGDNKDLMMDSPQKISKEQLNELKIKIKE